MTPAWTLRAWPPVYRRAGRPLSDAFEHRSTRVLDDSGDTTRTSGQTMWVWPTDDGDVGVAWDWVEVSRGVVAMLDPMSVLTNMKLLGRSGEVLTAWQATRHLNEIVFTLPWQREVRRALDRHEPRSARSGIAFGGTAAPARALGWSDSGAACFADLRA